MTKHNSCEFKCKFNSATCNSNQKWNNKTCQCEGKSYPKCKRNYSWNPSTCICENSQYLKSFADTSVIACNETMSVMDIVSTKITNTIARNVSIDHHSEKVRYKIYSYTFHTLLLAIILLLMITIICYNYAKHRSKQKDIDARTIQKWKIMNFEKFVLNIVRVIISVTIKLEEDFDLDNILINKKSHKNVLIDGISCKT